MSAAAHTATIDDFTFAPFVIEVEAGAVVEWRNADATGHTVTASRGEFSSGPLREGQSFRARFNTPGVYPYFCEPHEEMRGVVAVVGVAPDPAAPAVRGFAVTGAADQPSPLLPIAAVLALAGVAVGVGWRRIRRGEVVRYAAAAATAATGLLHLQVRLALDYPEPVGTFLVVEVAGAALLTVWLLAHPWSRSLQLTTIGAHAAALGALAITRTGLGLFGFREIGWDPSPQVPLAVAIGISTLVLLSAARTTR